MTPCPVRVGTHRLFSALALSGSSNSSWTACGSSPDMSSPCGLFGFGGLVPNKRIPKNVISQHMRGEVRTCRVASVRSMRETVRYCALPRDCGSCATRRAARHTGRWPNAPTTRFRRFPRRRPAVGFRRLP
ncbi:exported hypothetical protein [Streptomyces misionensis JCM 4497]